MTANIKNILSARISTRNALDTNLLAAYKNGDRSHDCVVGLAKSLGFKPILKRDLDSRFQGVDDALTAIWETTKAVRGDNAAAIEHERNTEAVFDSILAEMSLHDFEVEDDIGAEELRDIAARKAIEVAYSNLMMSVATSEEDDVDFRRLFMWGGVYHPSMGDVAEEYLRIAGI